MNNRVCDLGNEMGFIGYKLKLGNPRKTVDMKEQPADESEQSVEAQLRVFLACEEVQNLEEFSVPSSSMDELTPPPNIRFQHAIDIHFYKEPGRYQLEGIRDISALKKFNRFMQSLEERSRELGLDRNNLFRSLSDFLRVLQKTKNLRKL